MKSLYKTLFIAIAHLTGFAIHGQSLNPFSIGTLNPGDSVVIYYAVTINNPCGCSQVSNQGTISGSNFSALLTNDPKTITPNDATITLLNVFPLPVTLLEFRGNQKDGQVKLFWKANEVNVHHYEVEGSGTGLSFAKIGDVAAVGNGENSYTFMDGNLLGDYYYRLKIVDRDGKFSYSVILKFGNRGKDRSVSVYPNPVSGLQLTVRLSDLSAGQYAIGFYNALGQQVLVKTVIHAGGSTVFNLNLPKNSGNGVFTVVVKGKAESFVQKLFVEK